MTLNCKEIEGYATDSKASTGAPLAFAFGTMSPGFNRKHLPFLDSFISFSCENWSLSGCRTLKSMGIS